MHNRPRIVLTLALLLLGGCASVPESGPPAALEAQGPAPVEGGSAAGELVAVLEGQHERWRGTPYRYGGHSRSGVDCSGFVQVTYREHLGHDLPRTTHEQARHGDGIATSELRAGDLVFFRTGGGKRHVGIHLEGGRFLHASTSRGVTISTLGNPYWSRHF